MNIETDVFIDEEEKVEHLITAHFSAVTFVRHTDKEAHYKLEVIPFTAEGNLEDDSLTWFYLRGVYQGTRAIEARMRMDELESKVADGMTAVAALKKMDEEESDPSVGLMIQSIIDGSIREAE